MIVHRLSDFLRSFEIDENHVEKDPHPTAPQLKYELFQFLCAYTVAGLEINDLCGVGKPRIKCQHSQLM